MPINIENAKAEITANYEQSLKILSFCIGLEEFVSFVNGTIIFGIDKTYDGNMIILHEFFLKHGKYEMVHYYMNCGRVTIQYQFKDFTLQLHCTDNENALDIISKGKCKIVKSTIAEKSIVCETITNKEGE